MGTYLSKETNPTVPPSLQTRNTLEFVVPDGFTIKRLHVPRLTEDGVTAIPLVLPDDHEYDPFTGRVSKRGRGGRNRLNVIPEALEMVRAIRDPVSVLAICGPTRTGKSYIFSRVLGRPDVFDLGHSLDPHTYGIWVSTYVLKGQDSRGKDFCIIFLDTEGTDAVSAPEGADARIFVLTVLLSSQLVYNSSNVPSHRDLDQLECFSKLATSIAVRKDRKLDVTDTQYFPDFIWLLRDVRLLLPDDNTGKPMDPTQYIKTKVLKRSMKHTKTDEVASIISSLFPNIEAFVLPPPHQDPSVMQDITARTDIILDKEFNDGVSRLVLKLLSNCKAKIKRGYGSLSVMTGEAFSFSIEEYTAAINDPYAVPELKSTWESVLGRIFKKTRETLVMEYVSNMTVSINALPLADGQRKPLEVDHPSHPGEETLMSIHSKVFGHMNQKLQDKLEEVGAGCHFDDVRRELEETLVRYEVDSTDQKRRVCGGKLKTFIDNNYKLSKEYCTQMYQKHFKPIKRNMEDHLDLYTLEDFTQDVANLYVRYEESAKGPAKSKVRLKLDQNILKTHEDHFKIIKLYQDKLFRAMERARKKEDELAHLKNELITMKNQNIQTLKEMKAYITRLIKTVEVAGKERREEDTNLLQALQSSNFNACASAMQESSSKQTETLMNMMDQLRECQEKQAQEICELRQVIKSPVPREKEEMYRRAWKRKHHIFYQTLEPSLQLLHRLYSKDMLTWEQYQEVKCKENDPKQVDALMQIVDKRQPTYLIEFADVLREVEQPHVADLFEAV